MQLSAIMKEEIYHPKISGEITSDGLRTMRRKWGW